MPKISVIVPVYNVEKHLPRCIESILAQTFSDFELILVNDESSDNSGQICDEYSMRDNRIKVIHQKNGGPGSARNTGIDYVMQQEKAKWICFVDSDDWLHPQYLEILYKAARQENCKIAICRFLRTDEYCISDLSIIDRFTVRSFITEDFFCNYKALTSSSFAKLFNYKAFENIRFPNEMYGEDAATIYKVLFTYSNIVFVDLALYFYYQNQDGIMHSEWNPKKLFAIQAFREQMFYFQKRKLMNAFSKALVAYVNSLYENILELRNITKHQKERRLLLRELRRILRKYKSETSLQVQSVAQYYELAYPLEMKWYWYRQAIKRKIHNNRLPI